MGWVTAEMEEETTNYGCTMFLHDKAKASSPALQILAFETAKNMSRLISLYKSLTDDEFSKLRTGPVKSPGVAFLNSTDENYLLGLAGKEKLEDLNQIASVVSRLSKSCVNEKLTKFEAAYQNMKQGIIDINNLDFNSRNAWKIIEKMEKYSNNTSMLYTALTGLDELELSEKRMQRLNRSASSSPKHLSEKNIEKLNEKISFQRKQIRHFKQVSLWNKSIDKSVALMARTICTVYARICVVFRPYVPSLLSTTTTAKSRSFKRLGVSHSKAFRVKVYPEADYCQFVKEANNSRKLKPSKSSPILIGASRMKRGATRFVSSELSSESQGLGFLLSSVTKASTVNNNVNKSLMQSAPPNTVGAAGLTFRYADIIIMAETYFYSTKNITDAARKQMFEMLPTNLKQSMRGQRNKIEHGNQGLVEGLKESLEKLIGLLVPVAQDTLSWQQERNLEQQKFDAKPTVLLFQTLHFSDLEKTEAAIVEVLVGLSCIYKYQNRREREDGEESCHFS